MEATICSKAQNLQFLRPARLLCCDMSRWSSNWIRKQGVERRLYRATFDGIPTKKRDLGLTKGVTIYTYAIEESTGSH